MTQDQDCVFCRIGSGELHSDMLRRDDECFVIRDINPLAPTHLLIIPARHIVNTSALPEDSERLLGRMFAAARELAEQEGVAESGYRLIINQGRDGGQEVGHLHMHLLGGKRLRGLGLG